MMKHHSFVLLHINFDLLLYMKKENGDDEIRREKKKEAKGWRKKEAKIDLLEYY